MSDIKWIPLGGMELSAQNLAAAEKLRKFGFAVNCGEFGSEKLTKTGLCIYDVLQEKDNPSILLITSDRLLYGWYRILLTGLGVDFKVITGAPNALAFFSESCPNLFLMSRDALVGQNVLKSKVGTDHVWDLIIIDEEQNTDVPDYAEYQKNIPWKSEKLLIITQFPQRTQEDAAALASLIKSVMDDASLAEQAGEMSFGVNSSLFDADSPVMRYYGEAALSASPARSAEFCEYSFDEADLKGLRRRVDLRTGIPAYRFGGNIFEEYDAESLGKTYEKNFYTRSDVEDLRGLDKKLDAFIKLTDEIAADKDKRAMIYVCEKATADYLRKTLTCLYGGSSVHSARGEIFRSDDILRKLRVDDSADYPKFIIGIDALGAVGEGFDRIDTIINYELPSCAAVLERRMTRHGCGGQNKRFIIFRDKNKLFDSRMLDKVLFNTLTGAFCGELPTRNILLDIPQKGECLNNAVADLEYAIGYANEVDNCFDYIKKFKADYVFLGAEKINNGKQLAEFAEKLLDGLCKAFGITRGMSAEEITAAAQALNGLCYLDDGKIIALTENELLRLAKSFEGDGWQAQSFASEAVKGLSAAKQRIDELHSAEGYHLHIKQELTALSDCIQYPVLYGIWRYRVREQDSVRSFREFIRIYNDGI